MDQFTEQIERLGRGFEEFKTAHQQSLKDRDVLLTEKVDKLATVTAQQWESIQKAHETESRLLKARIDDLEAKLARPATSGTSDAETKSAKQFSILERSRKGLVGASPDIEKVRLYSGAYDAFLRRGSHANERLTPDEIKALSVGSDPDGGYWVEPTASSRIIEKIFESSPMRALATIETISGDELKLPYDVEEYGSATASETGTRSTTTTGTIGEYIIPVHEMYAKPKATQKLVEDVAFDIGGYIQRKTSEKFGRDEATWFVSGTGSGQARGILSYASGTSWLQVEQVNSGNASDLTYNGLINLVTSLIEQYHANARFLMKRASVANVMKLVDGDGRYIFQPTTILGFNATPLMGYPISFANDMPAIAANALSLAFGDFRAAYTIVDRVALTLLVDPYSAKPYIEYYMRRRVGGAVVNFQAFKIQKVAA